MSAEVVRDGAQWPGRPDKFGLGFAVNTTSPEKARGANTLSWSGLHNTFFWIDRDRRVCAVLLTQMLPFLDDEVQVLVKDFEHAVYAEVDGSTR